MNNLFFFYDRKIYDKTKTLPIIYIYVTRCLIERKKELIVVIDRKNVDKIVLL